jgi:hypothetical protein
MSARRLATIAVLLVLAAQGAFAAPQDDRDPGLRGWGDRVRHFIIRILDLDQLGTPRP